MSYAFKALTPHSIGDFTMSKSRFIRSSLLQSILFPSILALFLLGLATAQSANAQTGEQYAKGAYQFALEDRYIKYVEFEAQGRGDGSAVGYMTLTDEAPITYQDVDGTDDRSQTEGYKGYYIKAEFDSMTVEKNQAVMSGIIRDSSIENYIGQRVLLTVVDNGDNAKVPDQLTWGVYQLLERNWIPTDAEWKEDEGAGLRWWATDYERKDDVGYAMPRDQTTTTAQSFPISSYTFLPLAYAAGDIIVRS
jgi:hypothetical protein